MVRITRRSFLKSSAAVGAAAAISGTVMNTLVPTKAYASGEEGTIEYTPTTCCGCTSWCPVEIKTQTIGSVKRAIGVRGNKDAKRGDTTFGDETINCPRSHMAMEECYDPDRVKVPMMRTNPIKGRGVDPGFVPVSWDSAVGKIADNMLEMRGDVGDSNTWNGHKYLYLRGRYTYGRALNYDALKQIYGSPNSVSHSCICAEAENVARSVVVGKHGYDEYDLDECEYLLLWGVDPVSSNRMVSGTIHKMTARQKSGAMKICSVDPRLHATGAKADKWLCVNPATDGALALAMAHHILVSDLWNKDFVGLDDTVFTAGVDAAVGAVAEKGTLGLVEWWNTALKNMTPAAAEAITGISQADIEEVATAFASTTTPGAAISWCGPGITMQTNGVYGGMAALALNGLVGSFDHKGGEIQSSGSASAYSSDAISTSAYQDAIAAAKGGNSQKITKYLSSGIELSLASFKVSGDKLKPGGGTPTNRTADAINDQSPYEIKLIIGAMANFPFSNVGAERWEDALSGDMTTWSGIGGDDGAPPYVVDLTTNAGEFAMFADVVLPAKHNGLEMKGSTHQRSGMHKIHSLYTNVIEPVHAQAKNAENEFCWKLAQAFDARGSWRELLDYCQTEYSGAFGDAPLADNAPSEDFEDYHWRYCATKGSASSWPGSGGVRNAEWDTIKPGSTYTSISAEQGVGNGIFQGTYKASYWTGDGGKAGTAWETARTTASGGFGTNSGKVEFYNPTGILANGLTYHATHPGAGNSTVSVGAVLAANNYDRIAALHAADGKSGFMPNWEDPAYEGSGYFKLVDYKSRFNREGRSANLPLYHEFKNCDAGDEKWSDVIKVNNFDFINNVGNTSGEALADGDRVDVSGPGGTVECRIKIYNAMKDGVAAKAYGQGHWAYGNVANKYGGNNNTVMPGQFERLSGSNARNGSTKVSITKSKKRSEA